MTALIDQIRSWAATELRYWEQASLEKIVNSKALRDADLEELLLYFTQDAGLAPLPGSRPRLAFPEIPAIEPEVIPQRLERIFNLQNVNALPMAQEIRFGPQLTLIYGNNGVGKTGYARPLGCAAFARGEREVLPNATNSNREAVPQADLEIARGDRKRIVTWTSGNRIPELRGFYVFDGNSVDAHLLRANALSFSPVGLHFLTELAEITDLVRGRVRRIIEHREVLPDFVSLFEGSSEVTEHISTLSARTNVAALETLATLTEEQQASVGILEREIAQIKLQDVPKQIEKRRREIGDLSNLIDSILRAHSALGDEALFEATKLIEEAQLRSAELVVSGTDEFRSDAFRGIGTEAWSEFVNAAKALAALEGAPERPYPSGGDRCLLCHQPLAEEAITLIRRVWTFLSSDPQNKLDQARGACATKAAELTRVGLSYFGADSNTRRLLESELPLAVPVIDAQIEALVARQEEIVTGLRSFVVPTPPPLIQSDDTDLRKLSKIRKDELVLLQDSDAGQRLRNSEAALRELQHKRKLAEVIPKVKSCVEDLRWATQARHFLGSTAHITKKHNDLFRDLVTEQYTQTFEATLSRFKSRINVTIETRGSKGETVRQIVLNRESFPAAVAIDRILSEGERKAVAIADFLTEFTLDQSASGMILDDPVTSLDDRWKDIFALCLAEQARNRQVVVFTHDLSFLYRLKAHAKELSVGTIAHWIRAEDGQPGFVYLDDSPVSEEDYRHARIARDCYSRAKKSNPGAQQSELQQGFGALRTSYEALIIFEVLNQVVGRFEEVISFGRLKGVRLEQVDEIIKRMELLSRYIDAHLHSDKYGSNKPTPEDLFEEIEAFERIKKKQQQLKKLESGATTTDTATPVVSSAETRPKNPIDPPSSPSDPPVN
jgi:energy-coupling factor transporter ATP-binding protein EcfA2